MQTGHLIFTRAGGNTFFVDDIIHHASIKGPHMSGFALGLLSHRGNVLSCLLGVGQGRKGRFPGSITTGHQSRKCRKGTRQRKHKAKELSSGGRRIERSPSQDKEVVECPSRDLDYSFSYQRLQIFKEIYRRVVRWYGTGGSFRLLVSREANRGK